MKRLLLPIVLFAGVLALMQWIAGAPSLRLPLQTLAVFAVTVTLWRVTPWVKLSRKVAPTSRFYGAVLYLLFIRHFTRIFLSETHRILLARSLCLRHQFGPGGFTSLKWAVAGIFRRAIARAERFYAAQRLAGLGE